MELSLILIVPPIAAVLALVSRRSAPYVTLAAMLVVLVLASHAAYEVSQGAVLREAGGRLTLDALAALYLLLVAFVGMTASLYSIGYLRARPSEIARIPPRYRQYYPLFNIFLVSMLAVPIIANLAVVWIAIELTTIFSAFLVAYEDRAQALEAAWKYVVLTSMGAMIALLGVLIVYYAINSQGYEVTWAGLAAAAPGVPPAVMLMVFVLWLIGFGAKSGLVPLHTWLPDAHSQAPAPICALLSGVETSAALYMILRLYPALRLNPGLAHIDTWYVVSGLISLGVAAFLLIQVSDFKRLFAFSTIEHMGVILIACGLGTPASRLGATYQLLAHAFTKSFCFYAAGLATIVLGTQKIAEARGLLGRSPLAGSALVIAALAITGAPPFALFISEIQILRAGLGAHAYRVTGLLAAFIVLAFIAIIYQVSRIVFGQATTPAPDRPLPASSVAALALALLPMLIFGFYVPAPLSALIRHAAASLGVQP